MKKKLAALTCIFTFSLFLRTWNLNEMGRTWDEPEYVNQGYKMIELIKNGDLNNSYFYTTYDHPPLLKYLYGITAQFDVENYSPGEQAVLKYDLTYSRLLSAVIFSLGVAITTLIGWSIISPAVGIIAGIILGMLPFSLGLSQLVTTESFKIFIYPLAFYSYLLLLKKYSLKKLFLTGVITGIAFQIKQSNLLLIPLFFLMYISYYKNKINFKKNNFFNIKFFSIGWILIISTLVFILIMPHLPFHFSEITRIHRGYWDVKFSPKIWQITLSPPEVFFGRIMLTPIFYYIIYFFISIPIMILAFFFYGVRTIIFKKKEWILFSIILWTVVPFSLSFYSWRQHGLRYIIEIYPAISLITALGFNELVSKLTGNEIKKMLFFIPVVLYLFVVIWNVKPYYLDYFNEIVGGTNTVYKYKLFQQGWWGQGLREAGLYIKNIAPKGSVIGYALSPSHVLPRSSTLKYEKWSKNKKYDYVIVNHYNIIREGFNDEQIKKNYKLIYEVNADKATLVYIYRKK